MPGDAAACAVLAFFPHQLWEDPGIASVAAHETARVGQHAMAPFQADPLDPAWRTSLVSGQKVDRGPGAQGHAGMELLSMRVNPQFLFRRTEPDDQYIGQFVVNSLDDLAVLSLIMLESHRWTVQPGHSHMGPSRFNPLGRALGHSRGGASRNTRMEVCASAAANRAGTRSDPATRSGIGLPKQREASTRGRPSATTSEASSIGSLELLIVAQQYQMVDVGCDDVAALVIAQCNPMANPLTASCIGMASMSTPNRNAIVGSLLFLQHRGGRQFQGLRFPTAQQQPL